LQSCPPKKPVRILASLIPVSIRGKKFAVGQAFEQEAFLGTG
jgi:hypothetical protein